MEEELSMQKEQGTQRPLVKNELNVLEIQKKSQCG